LRFCKIILYQIRQLGLHCKLWKKQSRFGYRFIIYSNDELNFFTSSKYYWWRNHNYFMMVANSILLLFQWRNIIQHIRPGGNCCTSLHRIGFAKRLMLPPRRVTATRISSSVTVICTWTVIGMRWCIVMLVAMRFMFWQQFHRYFTQRRYSGPHSLETRHATCEATKMSTSNGFEQTHRVIVPMLYLMCLFR